MALGFNLDVEQGPIGLEQFLDDRHGAEVDIALEADGAVAAAVLAVDFRVADGCGERRGGRLEVFARGPLQRDRVESAVAGENSAVAVQYQPARGLDALLRDAVLLRLARVVVRSGDLQVEQPQYQYGEEQGHDPEEAVDLRALVLLRQVFHGVQTEGKNWRLRLKPAETKLPTNAV